MGQVQVHQRPGGHIEQEKLGGRQVMNEPQVGHRKGQGDADNADHGPALRHAQKDELMVNVVAVGQEGALAVTQAMDNHANHIEQGHDEIRESHDNGTGEMGFHPFGTNAQGVASTPNSSPMVSEPVSPMKIFCPRLGLPKTLK